MDVHRDVSIVVSSFLGAHYHPRGNGRMWLRPRRFHPIQGVKIQRACSKKTMLVNDKKSYIFPNNTTQLHGYDGTFNDVREPTNNDHDFL